MRLSTFGALSVLLGIILLQAESSAEKSGQCPHVGAPNTVKLFKCPSLNKITCKEDEHCGGRQKCCSELCVNKCRDPVGERGEVTSTRLVWVNGVKPGNCPPMNFFCLYRNGKSNHRTECTKDADCDGKKKCCKRCGMHCLDPR